MEVTLPYNFIPMEHQLDFWNSTKRFCVAVFHRRAGKSSMALNKQIVRTQTMKGIYYYVLPTYRQAKDVIWNSLVPKYVPMELVDKKNDSELTIYWKNGSIQKFVGCEDYDKHRGIDCLDVVFDEYSEMVEDVWTAIFRPVLARNGGTATFVFTPKGKNLSFGLFNFAKDHPEEWDVFTKTVKETNVISEKELESVRVMTSEALFNQEYMVDFLDSAGQFFRRVRENTYIPADEFKPQHYYQIGIDLAKIRDWTVITPFDLNTFRVLPQDRFNQVDWNLQKARITIAAMKYNNAQLKIDRTGVGAPIVEDLEREGLRIGEEGSIVFTQRSKHELLTNLAVLLERDKIKIPNDPGLIGELEAFQYSIGDKGQVKFGSVRGATDDRVMSLALAVNGVTEPIMTEDLRVTKEEKMSVEERYKCF